MVARGRASPRSRRPWASLRSRRRLRSFPTRRASSEASWRRASPKRFLRSRPQLLYPSPPFPPSPSLATAPMARYSRRSSGFLFFSRDFGVVNTDIVLLLFLLYSIGVQQLRWKIPARTIWRRTRMRWIMIR